jgi:DNA replication protein DnaC
MYSTIYRKPFLVLDDLGAEKDSEHALTTLYLIIDRRNRDELPTVVTTNYTPDEIESRLGARIASRLADMKTISLMKICDYRKRRACEQK